MNVSGDVGGRKGRSRRDFDINLAPIIDCLTVLIAFMLVSSTFLALGVLDASAGLPSSQTASGAKPPAINLEVHLGAQHELIVKTTGRESSEVKIAPANNDWNLPGLVARIDGIKKKWPDTQLAVLIPQDDIRYLQIIRIMEALNPHIASVLLGGF